MISQSQAATLRQENAFLGSDDVTLSNIDSIYQITDRKRRLIVPNTKINPKLQGIHVVCKVIPIPYFHSMCLINYSDSKK